MIPFDGKFAQEYALPLAAAAYNEPWNNPWNDGKPNPVLATFQNPREIMVSAIPHAPAFAFGHPVIPPTTHNLMHAMTLPKGAGVEPTGLDILAAEGGEKAPADADAPLPPTLDPAAPHALPPPVPLDLRFGWMCRDGHRLIVTFRGTQTPADWLHNFDFIPAPYLPIPGRGTVHQGFQLVYYAVRQSILDYIRANSAGVTEILVVGHSLGGAVAVLAIPDLLEQLSEKNNVSPILYNFAGPRAGHRDFASFFDAHINVAWRVVNVWDVVPHVPPLLAGYAHVGQQLTIDSGFHADVAANHVLRTGYVPGLASWNQHHPMTVSAAPVPGAPASTLRGLPPLAGISI